MQVPDDIRRLLEEYLTLSESEENQRRLRCWEPEVVARDQWHGRPRLGSFREEGAAPIQVTIQYPFYKSVFGPFSLAEVHQDPVTYLRFNLRRMIWVFRQVQDDIPLDRVMFVYVCSPFEPSFFGVPVHWSPDHDPLIDQKPRPPVQSGDDLEKLPPIDFYRSGMMPVALRIYEGVKEMVGEHLTVTFPEWLRSPFGVALYVRGYSDMLVDLVGNPEFSHAVMARIVQERQAWFEARARYLGQPVPPASIFNDEVDVSVISPRHYRNVILPHEQELSRYHKRISYWHSCGNIGPLARDITTLPGLEMLDVSGWTDPEQVLSTIDASNLRIERRFKPIDDLQDASPEWIAQRVRGTLRLCRQHNVSAVTLRVSGIQHWENPEADIAKVNQWIGIARRVVEDETKS